MYVLDKPDNLVEIFEESIRKYAGRPIFGTKKNGAYEWKTYAEIGGLVDGIRSGLAALGVKKGDAVGVIANNRYEWAVCCYATYVLGAKFVPMYEAELEAMWRYIIEDSGISVLFVSKKEIFEAAQGWKEKIPALKHVFILNEEGKDSFKELAAQGLKAKVPAIRPAAEDIAGLIYTSGTTGNPKGVLLSHGNFTSQVHALCKA
ncbi:MAG: AMP-binding protein, partial [Smithellaceae bacterium]|nr:AMP-binding protein [Smithellaceae bacterium]